MSLSIETPNVPEFDQATNTVFLGKTDDSTYIYKGFASAKWCIGEVPNGGYVASVVLGSVLDHFSTKHQTDPVALNSFYLQKTAVGHCIVEIQELKMSRKGYCVVRASLRQKGTTELCSIEDYKPNEWTDKLQAMITMGNMDAEEGLTHYTDCPKPFDLKSLVPHQFEWMKDFLNVRFDTRFFSHNNQPGRAEVNQQIGFKDKAVDFKSIPYFCDMFVPPPIMLGDVVHGGPIWTPTMQLEVQFKQKIKKDTKDILVHFISYHIINNRADIDGQIWDKEGRVLALTRHQCLLVPWSKNKSKI